MVGDAQVSGVVLRIEQLGWTLRCRYVRPVVAKVAGGGINAAVKGSIVLNRIELVYGETAPPSEHQ